MATTKSTSAVHSAAKKTTTTTHNKAKDNKAEAGKSLSGLKNHRNLL